MITDTAIINLNINREELETLYYKAINNLPLDKHVYLNEKSFSMITVARGKKNKSP